MRYGIHRLIPSVLFFSYGICAQILSPDRRIDWTPGIGAEFPYGDSIVSVADYGAAADGVTDDFPAFDAAIRALPSAGGIVRVPEGMYLITSGMAIGSSVVLRGEGCGKTRLLFDLGGSSDPCIKFITYQRGNWVAAVSGYEKGSARLIVADPSEFSAGQYVEIQQENDPSIMYTLADWDQSWAQNAAGQVLRLTAVSGDTLVLDKELYLTCRAELNPLVRSQGFVEYGGVERLYIKKVDAASDGSTILLKNAAFCLIREIESDFTCKSHVSTNTAYRCEIRDSYFHHSWDYGGSGHGYGTELGFHTTDCLVENNVFVHLRHSMMVHVGASGNVFGYNYSIDDIQADETANAMEGLPLCDISLHGHYGNFNLFESNIVEEIDIADYWGPMGPGNTFLRNVTLSEGIDIDDFSHNQNLLGNVTGSSKNVLNIHDSVQGTLLHGNSGDGLVQWDPSIGDHTVPNSLYLEAAPWFYGSMQWPSAGADIASEQTIPSKKRYEEGVPVAAEGPQNRPQKNVRRRSVGPRVCSVPGVYSADGRRRGAGAGIAQGFAIVGEGTSYIRRFVPLRSRRAD
jgi:hypothetical protein